MTTTASSPVNVSPVEAIRSRFPALERRHNGLPVAYFDGPGGTQVPRAVVDAMADYLLHHNANTHWAYPTSVETDAALAAARAALADFLGGAPVGGGLRRQHDDAHLPPRPRAGAAVDARATRSSSPSSTTTPTSTPGASWRRSGASS